jgi:hypothetical protein
MGEIMSKAERYRQHADECSAFAMSVSDPVWRGQLLAIAAQWRECARREIEIAKNDRHRKTSEALG